MRQLIIDVCFSCNYFVLRIIVIARITFGYGFILFILFIFVSVNFSAEFIFICLLIFGQFLSIAFRFFRFQLNSD